MSWIDDFMDEVSEAEAPDSYFYWSALSVLSAIVGRRIYVRKRRLFKVYPNLFVFLISQKSGLGKGFPVSVAENLVMKLGYSRVINGQASIEGIIKELSQVYTTEKGRIISTAEAFIVSGEFGALFLDNPKLFTNLTDLYDSNYHDDWAKTLSTQEKLKLKDLCLTGLFAANQVHFDEALPIHAKKGGFLGRVITVYESKRSKLNPSIRDNGNAADINWDRLLKPLVAMTQLQGEMTIEPEALDFYEKWYGMFYGRDNEDDTGSAERVRDNVLKVGMLLSIAERGDLLFTKGHMEEAVIKCTQSLTSTRTMLLGEGKAEKQRESKIILGLLINAKENTLTRREMLVKGYGDFDVNDLDRVMDSFIQSGLVKMEAHGANSRYTLTEQMMTMLKNLEEKK